MGLARLIGSQDDTLFNDDPARDHDDHVRDQDDHARDQSSTEPFERKPGHQYAENYPDPITGHPLQTYPSKGLDEFDSTQDWLAYVDALSRWTNYLPPRRPKPSAGATRPGIPVSSPPRSARSPRHRKSRHVGVRLTERDFELLDELARAHALPPGTMARILIVRAVRAAAHESEMRSAQST
jgi:hypothetical protein